jgi:hypothetical protein
VRRQSVARRAKSRARRNAPKEKEKEKRVEWKTHATPTVSRVPSLGSGEPIEKTVARRRLARPPLSCSGVTHHRGIGVLIV